MKDLTMSDCAACSRLTVVGIKCNSHRTESKADELIRRATEAGYALVGNKYERARAAEVALGLDGVQIGR